MALKLIAVEGMTIQFSDPTIVATVVITGSASIKSKAEGFGVYKDGLSISVSNITSPSNGATIPDPGPYTENFSATALKTKADGELVLRVDDETGTINATPKIPSTPTPIDFPVSFEVQVSAAGQTKAKAQ